MAPRARSRDRRIARRPRSIIGAGARIFVGYAESLGRPGNSPNAAKTTRELRT